MQIHNIFLMSKPNKLPAYQQSKFIMEVIDKERVTVVSGKTGCGKSTQIPQAILRAHPDAKVAVCEPRRLAATSLAERVSSEMNSKVGGLVGYHIGMEPRISENSRIIFMTYGIMIQKLMHNDKLDYTHIILDEVHERSLEMDFTFMALRKILDDQKVKRKIKLVIMSATINSVSFKEYFSYHKATE